MSITIACPKCKTMHKLGDQLAGKKVRCKECDRGFVVNGKSRVEPEEEDEQEERPRKPKRSKRNSRAAGIPVWIWAAVGGGGALLLGVILVVVIVIVARPRTPEPGKAEAPNAVADFLAQDKKGGAANAPSAPLGPHAAIIEEFGASFSAAADAMAQARDQASAESSAAKLRQERTKMDELARRLRAAGPAPAQERPRLTAIQEKLRPSLGRVETEVRQLQQRLPTMKLTVLTHSNLDQAMRDYGNSSKNFVELAKQNLP